MNINNFNALNLERMSEEEILTGINDLFRLDANIPNHDTPDGIMATAEILANLQPLYIEMDVRLSKEYQNLKHQNDNDEDILTYQLRKDWPYEHPNEKAPSIEYFRGKAEKQLYDSRTKEFEVYSRMKRFKENKNALVDKINVLKKKLDSYKYD